MSDKATKVKVAVRVRPMNKRELLLGTTCVVDMQNSQTILESFGRKGKKTFAFDHCFWSMDSNNPKFADQEEVFKALGLDILDNAFQGYNACIFAYGQTGSGKSYTMMGAGGEEHLKGIIPRLCDVLFERIAESDDPQLTCKVEVSYMEIYCEKVRDLLCPKGGKQSLKVREHKILGPYVENLSKLAVTSFKDIEELMSEGNKSRTVAATQMNAESSRSHAVFSILLTQTKFDPQTQTGTEKVAKISLVDLAGSERVAKSGALGDRLKEGSNINKSLTTLGLVISSLADISAGKKPKGSHIPYRDSTLTWLLKDNLGGNSKTVMVATISPASDNYEETLSTLRYADRAKRIVNHAVVNEDPNSRIIRELREEVERLRLMMLGGSGGGGGDAISSKELAALKEKLKISEDLMAEMSKSWEQKLLETQRIHQERQKALENMGISVQASGIGVQVDKYYLVNLNADPSMNELLVCYLKDVTRVGRADVQPPQDIQLRGLGIANEHCIIEIVEKEIFITPMKGAKTLVNGQAVTEKSPLRHGARILLGNNHLFRLSCPGQQREGDEPMDYEQAMKEISLNELTNDPMYIKMQKNLMEKHEAEKEDALEQQKAAYERELAKLKEKLDVSSSSISPTPPVQKPPVATSLEEEWEYRNRERLINTVLHANRLVQEANMLAHELNKETVFKVTLTVPRSFLSPRKMKSDDMSTSNEVAIRVLHKQRGTDSVWSLDQLEEKVLTMRDMYQRMEEEGRGVPMLDEPDPFYDLEQHALLGVANIYVEALHHDVRHEYDAPIIAPTGKECGKLKVAVERVPTHVPDRDPGEDVDGDESDWPLYEEVCELRSGVRFSCQVSVIEATGLPKEYCHYVFCQYHFWNQEEPMIIPPLVQSVTEKLPDGMQKFDHSQTFTVEVTEDFLEYLKTGVLAVEVWGHRRSGFIETGLVSGPDDAVEGRRPKSFLERWREHTHHLELWVEIMELNEQGEYESVETQTKADVLTGGVFMMRQGQSRRISVLVNQREGAGSVPLKCGPIKSISIGSIYLRSRYDGPLDSYQGHDIERLRSKWCSAVANRREFLDSELRKLMDRKGATVTEMERQNELLDQWAMLSWQRQALLEPRAGSGLPGAPTNWQLAPGMEEHVPVLFLDLNDDLLTPCDDDPVCAVRTGELFAEKEDTMIELPIIKRDDTQPKATASWDSTVHDNSSLNKVTGSNDRVYAILKVAVTLTHPPGIDLVLRKRICLRVYKRMSFGSTIMKAIMPTRDVKTGCGVMFDVVTGIPKSEGMQRPPKIPANPSFVELDEDENAVEKFKTAMASISNILTLDRLKQEVALKEKLSSTGRALKKRYSLLPLGDTTPVTVSPSPCSSESEGAHEVIVKVSLLPSHALPSQPQSLSRADSGNIYNRAESPQMESYPSSSSTPLNHEANHSQASELDKKTGQSGTSLVASSICVPEEEEERTTIGTGNHRTPHFSIGDSDIGPEPVVIHEDVTEEAVEDQQSLRVQESNELSAIPEEEVVLEEGAVVKGSGEEVGSVEGGSGGGEVEVGVTDESGGTRVKVEIARVEESGEGSVRSEDTGTVVGAAVKSEAGDAGVKSEVGDAGVKSEVGDADVKSEAGDAGVKSEAGDAGMKSEAGDAGVKSEAGDAGLKSEAGDAGVKSEAGDAGVKSEAGDAGVKSEAGESGEGDEKHEGEDMAKESAEKMDLSEVPSVLTTSSEGEVVEGEVAQEEMQENSNEQEESVMKSQEAIPLLQEPPSTQVNLGRRYSEGDINPSSPVKHKPPPAPHSQRASPNLEKGRHQQAATSPRSRRDLSPPRKAGAKKRDPSPTTGAGKRASSPTPSTESESSSISESMKQATPTEPPPFAVGERVIVEIPQGFKLAVVKFIGETEFAPGEWIGVAFERPTGKNNGTVKGVKYFKCKDKHGMFVRRDKITVQTSSPAASRVSSRSSASKSSSPHSQRRVPSNPNTLTRPTIASSAKRSPGSSGSSGGRLQFPKV